MRAASMPTPSKGSVLTKLAVIGMLAMLHASAARAETKPPPPDADARVHFEAGRSYFDTGEYDASLREFLKAYEMSKRAKLFYNIALSYERLGDAGNAAAYFRRYLAEVPEAENRELLQARAENLQRRAEQQDRERQAAADAQAKQQAELQAQQLAAQQAAQQQANRQSGDQDGVRVQVKGSGMPVLIALSFVAAGVGLAAQVTFGVLALNENGKVADGCGATRTCSNSDISTLKTYALMSDVGLATAIAGGALGLVLMLTNSMSSTSERRAENRFMVTPWVDARAAGGGANAMLRF